MLDIHREVAAVARFLAKRRCLRRSWTSGMVVRSTSGFRFPMRMSTCHHYKTNLGSPQSDVLSEHHHSRLASAMRTDPDAFNHTERRTAASMKASKDSVREDRSVEMA